MKKLFDISQNILKDINEAIINPIANNQNQSDKYLMYPRVIPTNSSGCIDVSVNFLFQNKICDFTISIPKNIYEGAQRSTKTIQIPIGTPEKIWTCKFYSAFVDDETQKIIIQSLVENFRKYKQLWRLSDDEYAEFLTTYVQSLIYDRKKFQAGNTNPRFPVETIVDMKGICSDKSILLAGLLESEGFSVSLLSFKQEAHMTVGISVQKGYDYHNSGFAVIETTNFSYIGDTSGRFDGGMCIKSNPIIIPIGSGIKKYSKISEVKIILQTETELQNKLEELTPKMSVLNPNNAHDKLTIQDYNSMVALYSFIVKNKPNRKTVIDEIEKSCV